MTTKRKPYKTYTKEFKLEAVQLMETSGRQASEIAMELGLRRNQLYKWKNQLAAKGETAFTGQSGRPKKPNRVRPRICVRKTSGSGRRTKS